MIAAWPALLFAVGLAAGEPVQHFEPQALYGYIDGGAELFLEFGFVGLDVRTVQDDDEPAVGLEVEVYRMRDPIAALGIYLTKCGRQQPWPEVVARNTASGHQLTAVAGSVFLQIKNPSGNAAGRAMMVALANAELADEPAAPSLEIWNLLPAEGRIAGSEFLVRGRFALEPFFTFGEGDALQLEAGALGAGARYPEGKRLVVVYPDAQVARAAFGHLKGNLDPYLHVLESAESGFVFADYSGKFGRVALTDDRLDIVVQLGQRPRLGGE